MKNTSLYLMKKRLMIIFFNLKKYAFQRQPNELIIKIYKLWKRAGLLGLWQCIYGTDNLNLDYQIWIRQYDTLKEKDINEISQAILYFNYRPLISILLPIRNIANFDIKMTIDSICNQLYSNWELNIAVDTINLKKVHKVLEKYQCNNLLTKITITYDNNIPVAIFKAVQIAKGNFITYLETGDTLPKHALFLVAKTLCNNPNLQFVYSDHDSINKRSRRLDPIFKPNWDPNLIFKIDFITQLGVCRTNLLQQAIKIDCHEPNEVFLRLSELLDYSRIAHIPHILYHKKIHKKSRNAKFSTISLQNHFARLGKTAEVLPGINGFYRIKYPILNPAPKVSIIIPTRNSLKFLERCISSLLSKTTYPSYEIFVIDNQSNDQSTLKYLDYLCHAGKVTVLRYNTAFNYSAINNFAVTKVNGDILCLLNNDIEIITEDWLSEMVSLSIQPKTGAVGAMLYYPNDTIQHAGVFLGLGIGNVAGHLYCGSPRGETGYLDQLCMVHSLSAVTAACMVVRKTVFTEVGGLDEINLPIAFNDVDFCLRLQERGYHNIWTPFAELYHHESASRGKDILADQNSRFQKEITYMHERWGNLLNNDPAYNSNLALDGIRPKLAYPPRAKKVWLQ